METSLSELQDLQVERLFWLAEIEDINERISVILKKEQQLISKL